eukprot:2321021-Alexandrium_andersonii.AAC.1
MWGGYFDAAQIQTGVEADFQAAEDFGVVEDVGASHWASRRKRGITPMRWGYFQKTPVLDRGRLVAKGSKER